MPQPHTPTTTEEAGDDTMNAEDMCKDTADSLSATTSVQKPVDSFTTTNAMCRVDSQTVVRLGQPSTVASLLSDGVLAGKTQPESRTAVTFTNAAKRINNSFYWVLHADVLEALTTNGHAGSGDNHFAPLAHSNE